MWSNEFLSVISCDWFNTFLAPDTLNGLYLYMHVFIVCRECVLIIVKVDSWCHCLSLFTRRFPQWGAGRWLYHKCFTLPLQQHRMARWTNWWGVYLSIFKVYIDWMSILETYTTSTALLRLQHTAHVKRPLSTDPSHLQWTCFDIIVAVFNMLCSASYRKLTAESLQPGARTLPVHF